MYKGGYASKILIIDLASQADLDTMLDEYYTARGWDGDGNPIRAKLKGLGIKSR